MGIGIAQLAESTTLEPILRLFAATFVRRGRWVQVSLPLRLGGAFNAGRCDPQTSAGIVANETASGCGSARDNALLVPAPASSPAGAVSA